MSNTDKANVDLEAIRNVVKAFEKEAKTKRVFFPEDAVFAFKYDGLIKSAASVIKEKTSDGVVVVDNSIHVKGDVPVSYGFGQGDVLAIFDNTKVGFFGNILKKECVAGAMITSKGILCYNVRDGQPRFSGFVSWTTVANCTSFAAGGFNMGVTLFEKRTSKKDRTGPKIALIFENAESKTLQRSLDKMVRHLKFIVKGCEGEFCDSDYNGEDDCDDEA